MPVNIIKMVFIILLINGWSSLAGQQAGSEQSANASTISEQLKSAVTAFQQKNKIPGMSVAVGQRSETIFNRGFGFSDLENRVAATPQTVYRTASIAKPLTAIAVLQLVERGKIQLDQPIGNYCPEFPETETPPTVRQLLCHQGGIRHYKNSREPNGTRYFPTLADSLKLFIEDPLLAPPGTRFIYTTYGYSLLGRAVETTSGQSFDTYLQRQIFDRANMQTAGLDNLYQVIPHRTRGYAKLGEQQHRGLPPIVQNQLKPGDVVNCQLHDTSMKIPGGGLICSAPDLVQLGDAMLKDRLLQRATRNTAWARQATADGRTTSYGLGWVISSADASPRVSHSGGQAGTSTYLMILPKQQIVIAIMANLQGAPCGKLADSLRQIVETASPSD